MDTLSDSNFEKVVDLWYEDGSIVLVAREGDDEAARGYRVHRSLLAKHSTIFADMLSCPQPEDNEQHEGCPVVRLADPANHVGHLLCAVYDLR
jgi:hypothetical protein